MADKKIKKVVIELNEAQAMVTQAALEEWFRLRMGQSHDLANDLAFMGYKRDDKNHKEQFDAAITKRNNLEYVIRAMFHIAWPNYGTPREIEPRTHIASDIWSALRHEIWKTRDQESWSVCSATPIQLGPEPMPVVTVTTEE